LAGVVAGGNEGFESLRKRFNRRVQQTGILSEVRRREHCEKPGVSRKRKRAVKRRSIAGETRR
jgi:small subunit ribosomal protein S21